MRTITQTTARRLAITRQRLAGERLAPNKDGILELVRNLGCLQLDPISAVARSHTLVLWSRLGTYDPAHLDELLYEDRQLFEYWAHAASIVLTEDYPVHHLMMREYGSGGSAWSKRMRAWAEENAALRDEILLRICEEGPVSSSKFEDTSKRGWESSGWNGGRNVGRMIDYLWTSGVIMVAKRSGLQKQWDLAERCLPDWTPRDTLSEREIVYNAAQRSLRALGIGRAKHINQHYIRGRYPNLQKVLNELEAECRIERVHIDGGKEWAGTWYIHTEDLPLLERLEAGEWEPRTTLLSPFDNLICDRARTELLFNFRFRIEIYVPKEKREYGYYVLPILHGDRLIGRIDPLMDRKQRRLQINAVYAEPDAPEDAETAQAVANAITELGTFLEAKEITYTGNVPDAWKGALQNSLG